MSKSHPQEIIRRIKEREARKRGALSPEPAPNPRPEVRLSERGADALMFLTRTLGEEHSTTRDPYAVHWQNNGDGVRASLYLTPGEERCEIHAFGHGAEDKRRSYAVIGYCACRSIGWRAA
jgi:hypothetical protein